ncbi:MAG: ABC transporter substrate-binding protein, partial [Solirubrobacteraceae bacterium]|nr:ABC transporter substrate-binding protein [Solirubrobacteraceae bacterium]
QMIVGNASLYNTIGDSKPVFGTPTVPADYSSDNNFNLLGAGYTGLPAMAIYAATTLKAKNVAMVYADEPGGQAAAGLVEQFMSEYGVGLTKVPVPTTSTDVIGAITAAKAQSADVFLAVVTAPLCIQIQKAKEQLALDVPVVSTVLCTDKAVADALGDIPSWTFGTDTESPFLPDASPEAATFVAKLRQYAGDDANIAGFAPHPFAKILTLAKLMNELGADAATPEAIADAARAFSGPMWMGGPKLECGAVADLQAICNTNARLYTYEGDGAWSDATDGAWVDVANPPSA